MSTTSHPLPLAAVNGTFAVCRLDAAQAPDHSVWVSDENAINRVT